VNGGDLPDFAEPEIWLSRRKGRKQLLQENSMRDKLECWQIFGRKQYAMTEGGGGT